MLSLIILSLFFVTPLFTQVSIASEGMWTLDNLPREDLQQRYGFSPDTAWTQHAMHASVRLAGGCSGSFVSPNGLVLTNHHCVVGCTQDLSTADNNLVKNGFLAKDRTQERQCPGMEVNRLDSITDVTDRVQEKSRGLTGKSFNDARKAEFSRIEKECTRSGGTSVRCDIVQLYQGGLYHLYRYKRYQDVRLAFAPEYEAGFFGGDPDNFNFPRFNFDMGLLRVYEGSKPIHSAAFFPIREKGAEEGDLVMTLGHPGSTERHLTVAQLETLRDTVLPFRLLGTAEFRGVLTRYSQESDEHARQAQTDLFGLENSLKARLGSHRALLSKAVMTDKLAQETELRAWVEQDVARKKVIGDPWTAIEEAEHRYREMYVEYVLIERGLAFQSQHIDWARTLVRAAKERSKPDGQRLREFTEAALPELKANLLADTPLYPDYEKLKFGWSLGNLRENLGTDHPFVRELFGKQSPNNLAATLVGSSTLADVNTRATLWDGGLAAVAASTDPAIRLAELIERTARPLRDRSENEVEALLEKSAEQLARARFERYGTSVYPDATFSLRLSHGVIRGWQERGKPIPPFTTLAGLFDRATDDAPYRLPATWLSGRSRLELSSRLNQVSTNDIIGGNSGSPLINAAGEIVGLVFDGNIHSLGGNYFFDESVNRTVSVHPEAMLQALKSVYAAEHILDELTVR
jgi:Peptidase S46